ncbi:oligosaccharide flippase family protein [Thalassotalea euphylliae]|uniref:oligosaccharide flippase family protein n=1 Tax=Thalassotalea euphylliae TaxID=1655234 RepID=UPI0015F287C5|nr:oligosaccharide flippase family protein [Thalassotalea euphylliae]
MSLKKNISWSALTSIGSATLDILKIAILARFLVAEDFGVFAIALVVLGFSQLFSEGGIGNAIISQKDITTRQVSILFNYVNLISVIVLGIASLLAPVIAGFYELPALAHIIPLLLISLPFAASSRVFVALLQKQLALKPIAIITISSKLIGLLSGIVAALYEQGVWSLVYAMLAMHVSALMIAFYYVRETFNFEASFSWREIKSVLNFSLYQLGEFNINFFARNLDILLITKFVGAEIAGQYSIIKNLFSRFGDVVVSTFTRVFHPKLANSTQREELVGQYQQFNVFVVTVVFIGFLGLAINHELFINLLLGEGYNTLFTLVPIMCLWMALRYSTAPVSTLWMVRLKPHYGLYWNIGLLFLVSSVIYLTSDRHIEGIVTGLAILQAFILLFAWCLAYQLLEKQKQFVSLLITRLLPIVIYTSIVGYFFTSLFNADSNEFVLVLYTACSTLPVLTFIYKFEVSKTAK